jgi:prepilin-type N-terminal cleavage/methylation domain-containing protein
MKARARRAFSLVELLTVIGIIALLISILMPALGRAREIARRTVCLANLRGIAQGCVTYAEGSKGHLPSWGQTRAGFNAIGDAWDWDGVSTNTFSGNAAPAGFSPVSNTRNLWKLVQLQAADTKTWLCPSDGEAGEPFAPAVLKSQNASRSSISDVQNRSQFSYAFQYQGPALVVAAGANRDGWNTTLKDDPKLVILADSSPAFKAKNASAIGTTTASDVVGHTFEFASSTASSTFPTGKLFVDALTNLKNPTWDPTTATAVYSFANSKDQQDVNSPNHRGEGQNFLRLDGSGDFAADPWAGAYKDNIWTVQDSQYYNPSSPGSDDEILRARMRGLYDAGSAAGAGAATTATYDVDVLMSVWVKYPQSKRDYPDSFLVP